MMKPYPQSNLTVDKRIYNYRHSRVRRKSENLFGILASKWRIYYTMIALSSKRVENIILSTLALHNMLCKSKSSKKAYRPPSMIDSYDDQGNLVEGDGWSDEHDYLYPLKVPTSGHNPSLSAKLAR